MGFELGLQRAFTSHSDTEGDLLQGVSNEGATCVGYSEIDKYAIKVYERHFNGENSRLARERECDCSPQERQETLNSVRDGVSQADRDMHHDSDCSHTESDNYGGHTNYGDATTINAKELPDFDLLVGGFPCQAFSVAGKRGGFNDTRGTLFFDIARILAEKRPRHLLLENVKGLLSHDKGKTFSTIIGVLSDLGYRVEWQVLNSKDFGVPQNRERVFIIGHLGGECGRQVFPIGGTDEEDTRIIGQDVAYAIDANYHKGTNTLEKSRRSIVQVNQPKHSNDRVYGAEGVSPTINTMQGGRRQPFVNVKEATKKGYDTATEGDSINFSQPNSKTRRGRVGRGVANTPETSNTQATLEGARIRRLTPLECERLQGFPDDWTALGIAKEPISDTQRYKMCGNAVTVNVIEAIVTNFKCLEPQQ